MTKLPPVQSLDSIIFQKYAEKYPPFGALEEDGGEEGTAANADDSKSITIARIRIFRMNEYEVFIGRKLGRDGVIVELSDYWDTPGGGSLMMRGSVSMITENSSLPLLSD